MSLFKRPGYSWAAALLILVAALAAEMLPIVGGTGAEARFDWSFAYVTLHFVLLPLGAVVHLAWNGLALAFRRRRALRDRLLDALSTVISIAYLALLQARPLFPLWGDVLWENLKAGP